MYNILITAGGTSEPIDHVRQITNSGTGRLGSLIAAGFAAEARTGTVFYVHARNAVCPPPEKVSFYPVRSVADLEETVTALCAAQRIDAVIHSMAVSDYRVRSVSTASGAWEAARASADTGAFLRALDRLDLRGAENKLSSRLEDPVLLLERTPKILPLFRRLAPEAVITGFKLLDGVETERLLDTAFALLLDSRCDFVLANDLSEIDAARHRGWFLDAARRVTECRSKQEIADVIRKNVWRRLESRAG